MDYQLLEEEGEDGTIRLSLRISPDVGELDEAQVIDAVIGELRGGRPAYRVTAELWRQARTISVERRRPIATRGGKVLSLHVATRRRVEEENRLGGHNGLLG